MVLSNVGVAGLAAMRSISASLSSIAVWSAGLRSDTLKRPNGGTPPQGPVHGASSGFAASLEAFIVASGFDGLAAQPSNAISTGPSIADRGDTLIMFPPKEV